MSKKTKFYASGRVLLERNQYKTTWLKQVYKELTPEEVYELVGAMIAYEDSEGTITPELTGKGKYFIREFCELNEEKREECLYKSLTYTANGKQGGKKLDDTNTVKGASMPPIAKPKDR